MSQISNYVRKRASKPKVRSGCVTCKFRRLKCDEGKPSCFRCTNSGIRCRGYAVQSPVAQRKKEVVRQAPVPIRPAPPSLSQLKPSYLDLDDHEQLYFQEFATASSTDPYGMVVDDTYRKTMLVDSFFWNEAVLPESHTSPCIRHGIIAISALVKSFRFDASFSNPTHEQFALYQYGKAIRELRAFIDTSKDKIHTTRTLFIACLVLAHFDCYFGHRDLATYHMQYARGLLAKSHGSTSESLDARFVCILMRLDSQNYSAMGFDSEFSYRQAIFGEEQISVPACFTTREQAVLSIDVLTKRAANFYFEIFKYRFTPRSQIPRGAIKLREYFVEQLTRWDNAYCRYIDSLPLDLDDTNSHPILRPQSLRLHGLILLTRLVTSLNERQSSSDGLLPYFKFLVSYSKDVINYEKQFTADKPYFDFEIRTIIPLYAVAVDCRNCPSLRSEALSLLDSSNRREGAWDSRTVAMIARWKISMESQGMDIDGCITEHARLYGECFVVDRWREEIRVTCRRRNENLPGGHQILTSVLKYGATE